MTRKPSGTSETNRAAVAYRSPADQLEAVVLAAGKGATLDDVLRALRLLSLQVADVANSFQTLGHSITATRRRLETLSSRIAAAGIPEDPGEAGS